MAPANGIKRYQAGCLKRVNLVDFGISALRPLEPAPW